MKTKEEIKAYRRKKLSNTKEQVPCLWCSHKVPRCDMPRVGVCKICYAKKDRDLFKNYQTWDEFFTDCLNKEAKLIKKQN